MRRPSLSKRMRFLILERDRFTCRYCGRSAPDVVLHIDHVHAWAAGGSHTPDNFVTACSDCNLGKATERVSPPLWSERQLAVAGMLLSRIAQRWPEAVDAELVCAVRDFGLMLVEPEPLIELLDVSKSYDEAEARWLRHSGFPEYMWEDALRRAGVQ